GRRRLVGAAQPGRRRRGPGVGDAGARGESGRAHAHRLPRHRPRLPVPARHRGPPVTPAHPPIQAVQDAVRRAIEEDVLPMGDLTAALLDDDERGRGAFVSRADGVLAGRLCADEAFRQVDPSLLVTWQLDDGDAVSPGSVIGWVEGRLASILTAERTALNFL